MNDIECRVVAVLAESLGCDPRAVRLDERLVEDLGATQIDLLDVIYRMGNAFGRKLPALDESRHPTVADLVALVSDPGERPRSAARNPGPAATRPASPERSLVLRCPACFEATDQTLSPPGLIRCPRCPARFVNLGPLPIPNVDVVVGAVLSDSRPFQPPPARLEDLPPWVCSWCGRNAGTVRRVRGTQCPNCSCAVTRYPALSLRDHCRGLSGAVMGAYREIAVGLLNMPAALFMLGRIPEEQARDPRSVHDVFHPPFRPRWWEFLT